MSPIEVILNGEVRRVTPPLTLAGLLDQLGLDHRGVVVEHNREIIRAPDLSGRGIAEGDAIEVVHFVGGG